MLMQAKGNCSEIGLLTQTFMTITMTIFHLIFIFRNYFQKKKKNITYMLIILEDAR